MLNMGFIGSSISSLLPKIKTVLLKQAEKQNTENGTHQISFRMNEKCWRNFKVSRPVII